MSRSPASTPAGRRVTARRARGSRTQAGSTRSPAKQSHRGTRGPASKPGKAARNPGTRQARRPKRRSGRKLPSKRTPRRSPRRREGRSLALAALTLPLTLGAALLRLAGSGLSAASWRARIALVLALTAAVAGGYFLYLRDSPLVAVTDVEVVGVRSGEPRRIIAEFDSAAREMTTLNVDRERLERIAAAFPTIESVSVDPNFPHGLRIEVAEHEPALIARSGGQVIAVAGDGTLLAGIQLPDDADLPTLELERPPEGVRLEDAALEQALAVGAAPDPLRPLIEQVGYSKEFGVEVGLRGGIPVRFGTSTRAQEKWRAAAAVLADGKLETLTYVDVRVPERPAAGAAAASLAATDPPA